MRFFVGCLVFTTCLLAHQQPQPKPEVIRLKPGKVREALKKNYRIHLVRNFQEEADLELKKMLSKKP